MKFHLNRKSRERIEGFDSLREVGEKVRGSFTFTILDQDDTLSIIKGDSPLYLIHFPTLELYVYASTIAIMKETLEKSPFNYLPYEVINVEEGRDGVPKYLILSTIDKKQIHIFRENIQRVDPKAMIMIQNTVSRVGGYDHAKILSTEDYHKAYGMYLERRKKSLFGLQKDMVAAYEREFQLTGTEALKILLAVRDDRVVEKKSKRAAQIAAASMPPRKGK